jgi:tRNA-guanine family transglycosylase
VEIIEGAAFGGELFDVEFPFFLAENESAFMYQGLEFPKDIPMLEKYEGNYEALLKNRRSIIQDLYNPSIETDPSPIDPSCSCYTCKGFSKAYLFHLLRHKEMTGNVLLVLHNMHCFEQFFKNLKEALNLKMEKKFFEWFLRERTVEGDPKGYKKKEKRVNLFEKMEED